MTIDFNRANNDSTTHIVNFDVLLFTINIQFYLHQSDLVLPLVNG